MKTDIVGWEACPRVLLMTSVGNRTPDLLISGPPPYQLGHEITLRSIILYNNLHMHIHTDAFIAAAAFDLRVLQRI